MADLIDRQQAIDAIENAFDRETILNRFVRKIAIIAVRLLPPVTPKQRTGKWIPQDHNKRAGNISTCVYYYPTCSKCGQVGNDTYKYCPHCGSKMTEGDAE